MPIARPGKPSTILTISVRSCNVLAACRLGRPKTTWTTLLWFKLVSAYEGVHPLEGGAFRRKFRRDRRNGLPRENPFLFYPRYFGESVVKMWRYWSVYRQCKSILDEVRQRRTAGPTPTSRLRRQRTTNSRRSISTMRPPEAKPRSRASTVMTLSGRARTQPSRRVPTIGFDLLYVLVIVRLARRDLVWINVTTNPTAEWIARQVTEAFPWNEAPPRADCAA